MNLKITTALGLTLMSLIAAPVTMAAEPATTVAKPSASNPATLGATDTDPRQYLEDVQGEAAMTWVEAHNKTTLNRLMADPRFEQNRADVLKIVEATDRIPAPTFAKGGHVDNFWQDKDHTRGIWRRTTWQSYMSGTPKWETILDFDALSAKEGQNWVYKGANCLEPDQNLCLIYLSNGGKDAVTVREFDISKRQFVEGGFSLPEGKLNVTWVDKDTLYVSREWVTGEVTTSGYAYVTKSLKRGQSLDQAVENYRGTPDDVASARSVIRDVAGRYIIDYSHQGPDFFTTVYTFYTAEGPVTLPLPISSELQTVHKGQAVYWLKEDWKSAKGTSFKAGQVIGFDFAAALKAPNDIEPVVIYSPDAHQSVEAVMETKDRLVIQTLDNVTGVILSYGFKGGKWAEKRLKLPENATLNVGSADSDSDSLLVWSSNYLQPATLYRVDTATGTATKIKSSPDRFNTEGLEVDQRWATSKDGTQIPYFIVYRKDMKLDGQNPTLLYAYGGFEVSMKPNYSGTIGKLWLEKGGVYVVANIRGGGEFGPAWHEAGLKQKRQVIYDDFQAVAEDMIADKVTSPRRLGIMGGSNGGLLMGVQLTQRPDLWNAVVIQVPLLDMMRFHLLLAGASWQGEYGRPDDASEGAFLKTISPYHNLKAGVAYPEPLFVTSTKDDRVHPGHARKMAALMEEMGLPFLYYENTDGGHAAAANLKETAKRQAIEFTYLQQKLMD